MNQVNNISCRLASNPSQKICPVSSKYTVYKIYEIPSPPKCLLASLPASWNSHPDQLSSLPSIPTSIPASFLSTDHSSSDSRLWDERLISSPTWPHRTCALCKCSELSPEALEWLWKSWAWPIRVIRTQPTINGKRKKGVNVQQTVFTF